MLLASTELSVKDLTEILHQSQPRLSRHLKLLTEAGLIERFQEGSWVFYRLAHCGSGAELIKDAFGQLHHDDPLFIEDRCQAEKVKNNKARAAQDYFNAHASDWDRIRAFHVGESDVEQAMLKGLGGGPFDQLIDMGTGTGRILELFAGRTQQGIGIDCNAEMLRHARARLERLGLNHCQLRQGDICQVKLPDASSDAIIIHQVLHFFDAPEKVLKESARLLKPGGKILIADFAPHKQEFLRDNYQHQRLGFEQETVWQWLEEAGLIRQNHQLLKSKNNELAVALWSAQKVEAGSKAGLNKSKHNNTNDNTDRKKKAHA